jgi:cytidine deaminase
MPTSLNFFHHGTFAIGDSVVMWKEKEGGEIILKEESEPHFHRFSDFAESLQKQEGHEDATIKLEAINKLLAYYRPHALPDENGYYAASAGVYRDGRLFIAVNNEVVIKHAFAGRGCAETTMLRKCQEATGDATAQLKAVYLMSGRATKMPSGALREERQGNWSCLCGECRQNLRAHTENAEFIMLPTNDGTKRLKLADAPDTSTLKPFQAWRIPHAQLYPIPSHRPLKHDLAQRVWDGYETITRAEKAVPALSLNLPENIADVTAEQYALLRRQLEYVDTTIPGLNHVPTLSNINRALVQLIKQAYRKHEDARGNMPNIEITAVLIKTEQGEFYPSILVNGDLWLPSKPPEMPTALSNAYNQMGIGDVYMMTFDNYQLQNDRMDTASGEEVSPRVKMPDPAGLGRLLKNMKQNQNATLRVIPINDGTLSEALLCRISEPVLDIRQAFGPNFTNPKRTVAAGRS